MTDTPQTALRPEATRARNYFPTVEAFAEVIRLASARASKDTERRFTENLGRDVARWGLGTYLSSRGCSWLVAMSKRELRGTTAPAAGRRR